ncbi:MAG: FtsX-like permease family protein [Acidimicrobiales bacterium]
MDELSIRSAGRPSDGGIPARRAVTHWAWRLFRSEWRQQFLILALITVAVAATILGSSVAVNNPPPKNAGFGTAQYAATFTSDNAKTQADISKIEKLGTVQVIENTTYSIPGSINTYQLRSQAANGPYGAPMLSLVSGHFPSGANQVAVTSSVATAFHLSVGKSWQVGGVTRQVVGVVENPQSLLDEFALVVPGQVPNPTEVTVLFDASPGSLRSLGGVNVSSPASVAQSNPLNPETISLAALVLGMVLIALVSIGGFTVLAQRRMRSIGMLESIGATDRHVRLVVSANGTVVGVVGAILGFVVGFVAWLAYRPSFEQSAHHLVGVFALPWLVVIAAMVLAVAAAYFASSRPARAVTKIPVVLALSGRPAPPRQIHRSALPGIVILVGAFLLLGYAGGTGGGNGNGGAPELLLGLLLLMPGLILLAPFLLSLTERVGRHAPIAPRLALRDLARFRARSGSALAAISIGVLIAVIVVLASASRFSNVLDYAGPNLSSNQIALHTSYLGQGQVLVHRNAKGQLVRVKNHKTETATPAQLAASAHQIAQGLDAQLIALETPNAFVNGKQGGRNWSGQIYVATPQLLRAFGIKASEINPRADVLTSRPGLSGVTGLSMDYGSGNPKDPTSTGGHLRHPIIQEISALPSGTSAPNTVVTEYAMKKYHISSGTSDWLVVGTQGFTAAQISAAQLTASTAQLQVESRNDIPSGSTIINDATLFGILIALGILAMSVGLVRSETASDMRTLAATGASSYTRRTLTAVTAGALGFLGALLGVVGGYVAMLGFLRSNSLNGGISALTDVPVRDLMLLLIGMPLIAAAVGWLFSSREPAIMGRQPIE